jgi:uncharacterized protein YdbL (DUF1318 family)
MTLTVRCFILAILVSSTHLNADTPDAALERMLARQGEVEQILRDHQAGEDENGFLAPYPDSSESTPEIQALIDAENADRLIIYGGIAAAKNVSSEAAGEERAKFLRERLMDGIFRKIASDDGKWIWGDGAATPSERKLTRLLTRPGASLFAEPEGEVLRSPIAQFSMFEVSGKKNDEAGELWYEVAELGKPVGWIRESQALEWYQALVMKYTRHPDRTRVLFFDRKIELKDFVETPLQDRSIEARRMEEIALQGGDPGRSVVAIEAEFDETTQDIPVVIPILDHEVIEVDGRESRLLRIAAATRTNNATVDLAERAARPSGKPDVDVVFLIDTTSSMEPYIEQVKAAVAEFSKSAASKDPSFRFGVVGYRDPHPTFAASMEYSTKNFTPDLLPADEFLLRLEEVKALKSDPGDPVPEDVFSGVESAVRSNWRSSNGRNSIRFVFLIGDASANHPMTGKLRNPGNLTGIDAPDARSLLNLQELNLFAVHIRNPKYRADHEKAEADFSELAKNPVEGGEILFTSVDYSSEDFENAIRAPFSEFLKFLANRVDYTSRKGDSVPSVEEDNPEIQERFSTLLSRAYVQWLAGQNTAPLDRDLKAWVVQTDPTESSRFAMDVHLLLSRTDLENLKRRLDGILEAANEPESSGDLFERIQKLMGNAIKDPSNSQLADLVDIPTFIENLPYKSDILAMKRGDWEDQPSDQIRLIGRWKSMSEFYGRALMDDSGWESLSSGDGEKFITIPLDQLP